MLLQYLNPILDLFYPPLCMHCDQVHRDGTLFCKCCASTFEPLDPMHRCKYCFTGEVSGYSVCQGCRELPQMIQRVASVFEYEGAPATLIKKMKYGAKPYLAESAAAFMAAQFVKLGWPYPDCVTSIPMAWLKEMDRGFNQSELMAKHFADFIGVPYKSILTRSHGGYSQAGLSYSQRKSMSNNPYELKKSVELFDQRILIIDDVLTTCTTLRKCANALEEGCPSSIYALTFCRA